MASKGTMSSSHAHHNHHHHRQQIISVSAIHPSASSSPPQPSFVHAGFNMRSKEAAASYELGDLDQAQFMYFEGQDYSASAQEQQRQTLNIFPSRPMRAAVDPTTTKVGINLTSPASSGSNNSSEQAAMEFCNTASAAKSDPPAFAKDTKTAVIKKEGNRKASEHEAPETPDPKTLRRLAQNREAARKSRLRKKAYIQQLEISRIKLTQLEQELQRARTQGLLLGSGALLGDQALSAGAGAGGLISDETMFDMEYTRWLEEHHRLMCELRVAVQENLPEDELRMHVEGCIAHYDQMAHLKSGVIKSDVFHLISGVWMTPAERCFMWIGGFRPSELVKMLLSHIEPLAEQQILAACGMQQSMQEAEEALTQGLEALNHSLSDTITSDALSCPSNMANYMGQMAVAMHKLATLEGFVRQADNLRQQALHRLHRILTPRQMARCLLAMAEYFHRLRALSSLWLARPRNE